MIFNHIFAYHLRITISYLKCIDVSYLIHLNGGKVMGIIIFLAMTYFFNIVNMLKILMIIVK